MPDCSKDQSVRKFITKRFAVTSGPRNAEMFQRKSALRFKRGNVRLWRRRNARLFQGPSALRPPTGSAAPFPSRSVLMSLSFNVFRFPRLTVRISTDSLAQRFQSKIVNRRQEESAHWSHPLKPKK